MFELSVWSFVVRFLQAVSQAAPFILTGFLVAAVFRKFYGPRRTYELFGENRRSGLLRAWLIGMLLPVCSLGAIPVARELKHAGLSGGTILAFAIAAPLFNPLSLLYGLTLSEPFAILSFAGCSLAIVTLLGMLWDKLFPGTEDSIPDEDPPSYGVRRIVAVALAAGKDITSASSVYILIGLIGVSILGIVLPPGAMQDSFNHDDPIAPLRMSAFAIPVYATPMLAMSQMGMMFQHANSVGAAFVLLALGAGINLGLIAWMFRGFGVRRTVVWMCLLIATTVGLGYAVDGPLFPKDIQPAGHTHTFDIYCRPLTQAGVSATGYLAEVQVQLDRGIEIFEWHALKMLVGCLFAGLVLRIVDRNGKVQRWIDAGQDSQLKGDLVIPAQVLGGVALLAMVAVSVIGCYAYYPPPSIVLAEVHVAKGEALHAAITGDTEHATYWIEIYDEWSRKLEVGTYLRYGEVSDFHHWKARLLREQLELMEHAIEDSDPDETRQWVAKLQRTHSRLNKAYQGL